MESLEKPHPAIVVPDYSPLLLDRVLVPTREELGPAVIGTAVFHLVLILILVLIPRDITEAPPEDEMIHRVTRLIDPPTRLTQKAPNKAPVSQEISVAPTAPQPKIAPVSAKRFQPPPPAQVAKRSNPAPALPQEPPRVKAVQSQQAVAIAPPAVVAPPPPQTEQPKLVLENPPAPPPTGQATGRLKVPGSGITDAVRELSHTTPLSAKTVGDNTEEYEAPSLSPSKPVATRPKSSLEMLSDPNGVDMKPYLLQVLQNVRRNWTTIYPESARLGLRGRAVLQFSILPNGQIGKVVFVSESGREALDRAGVAALSMSNPLPALPPEYKGARLVLQFTFLYNAPR